MVNHLYGGKLSQLELALVSQAAEHNFAGVKCGLMDQYASMFGKPDHVIKLDCRSHEHEYFHFDFSDFAKALEQACNGLGRLEKTKRIIDKVYDFYALEAIYHEITDIPL